MASNVATVTSIFLKDIKEPTNALLIIIMLLTLENGLLFIVNAVSGIMTAITLPSSCGGCVDLQVNIPPRELCDLVRFYHAQRPCALEEHCGTNHSERRT
jgi:hypothetical protein